MNQNNINTKIGAFKAVKQELELANSKFPLFNSKHEGYAILKEEVDELWDEIKNKHANEIDTKAECVQVAAMAIKMLISPIWE